MDSMHLPSWGHFVKALLKWLEEKEVEMGPVRRGNANLGCEISGPQLTGFLAHVEPGWWGTLGGLLLCGRVPLRETALLGGRSHAVTNVPHGGGDGAAQPALLPAACNSLSYLS